MITKDKLPLLDPHYNHPNTSMMIFRFEPEQFPSIFSRLQHSFIQYASIADKDLYLIDDFFSSSEKEEAQEFSKNAPFSRKSYGSPEAVANGEKPAYSMNGKERWQFFSRPPSAVTSVYQLLSMLGATLDADITTLPWELCDPSSYASPAVIANKLHEASPQNRETGKHQDYHPEGKLSFGIPILYTPEPTLHPPQFINGAPGNPWLISIMLYTTDPAFIPEYSLGTVFYDQNGQIALRANCSNMRLILFEGDLFHSIEESTLPPGIATWRISYVFRLILNPKKEGTNIKKAFFDWMNDSFLMQYPPLGIQKRA